jgi:hypothetical protein
VLAVFKRAYGVGECHIAWPLVTCEAFLPDISFIFSRDVHRQRNQAVLRHTSPRTLARLKRGADDPRAPLICDEFQPIWCLYDLSLRGTGVTSWILLVETLAPSAHFWF